MDSAADMAEAAKAVDEGGNLTNEIQQRREAFLARFDGSGLSASVIHDLPLANNAKHMTGVDPDRIKYAIMSNISLAELCEVRFFFTGDDKAFIAMCSTGNLDTLHEVVSTVPTRMELATGIVDTVKSSEAFEVLRKILHYREEEGYASDTSNRDIVNFGSMMRILSPDTVTPSEELGRTVRRRLREFAFPSPHDDLIDRDDGDLRDVEIDYNAMRLWLSKSMDLHEVVFD